MKSKQKQSRRKNPASKRWVFLTVALVLIVVVAYGVQRTPSGSSAAKSTPFDGNRGFEDLKKIVAFGPRPSGSEAIVKTRAYIVAELEKAGLKPRLDEFEGHTPRGPIKMANIRATRPGAKESTIAIAGHFDTKRYE